MHQRIEVIELVHTQQRCLCRHYPVYLVTMISYVTGQMKPFLRYRLP